MTTPATHPYFLISRRIASSRTTRDLGHRGSHKADLALSEQTPAEGRVIEGAEGHGREIVGDRVGACADGQVLVDLEHARDHTQGLGHPEWRPAGGGLDGAHLVPAMQQHAAPQLAGDAQAGKARADHDSVVLRGRHTALSIPPKPAESYRIPMAPVGSDSVGDVRGSAQAAAPTGARGSCPARPWGRRRPPG